MPSFAIARRLTLGLFVVGSAAGIGCLSPFEALCQKQYDCRDELGINFEDDYPGVCNASATGAQAALRANAEQDCEDLANADTALATCLITLSCDDFANFVDGNSGDFCVDFKKSRDDAAEAAGSTCDAIGDDSADQTP